MPIRTSIDIPAVVINLARSRDRRAHMEAQLKGSGLDYHFFEAVDGHKLSAQTKALFSKKEALRWPFILFGHAMYDTCNANALSHLKVCEWMVQARIPRAMVMEDDVFVSQEFFTALKTLDEWAPSHWDVINFHITTPIHWEKLRTPLQVGVPLYPLNTLPTHLVVRCARRHRMAACYVLTITAAKRLLNIGYPIRMPADVLLGTNDLNGLNSYTLFPYLVRANEFPSTIGDGSIYTYERPIYPKTSLIYTIWRDVRYGLHALSLVCTEACRYPAARKAVLGALGKIALLIGIELIAHVRMVARIYKHRILRKGITSPKVLE